MVICLEQGADLHMAQLMPLPLTVSCFSKIQIGSAFLVSAHPGSLGQRAVKRVCVCTYGRGGVAICYVFLVSWFVTMAKNRQQNRNRGPHRLDSMTQTQTDTAGGSTKPEAQCDIYHCVVGNGKLFLK